ncbi:MAG TPA: hypothetical protein VLW54_10765 [Candidatus Acidoferrales bacterium]|nr:hypothetical protein [Candidatus Acidoferrales bacterium]
MKTIRQPQTELQEWSMAMATQDKIDLARLVILDGKELSAGSNFKKACSIATIALRMLLAEMRKQTSARSVEFFQIIELSGMYFAIGRSART